MKFLRMARPAWMLGVAAAVAGASAGVATISLATSATAQSASAPGSVFEVTHSPPLLTVPGEALRLEYQTTCLAEGVDDPEQGCRVDGTLHIRSSGAAEFREVALRPDSGAVRQLVTDLPAELLASPALEYFAVFDSPDVERRVIVPPGGAAAPSVSRRLEHAVEVDVGPHAFGSARLRGDRIVLARWGDGDDEVGLEDGRDLDPIGGSAFDVDATGAIALLDHANRRLLRWDPGSRAPSRIPLSVNGAIADLALAGDGSFYVLETTARDGRPPLVRRFDDSGRELETVESAERGPAQIRIGPDGPVVLQRPSHQWMPAALHGVPATPAVQRRRGRVGRPLPSGGEVVVLRDANDARIALIAGERIVRSWTISSATPLGEVQLAEPLGSRFVVVMRVYDDRSDEFVVLLLDRRGLVSRRTLDPADWAESAPLSRFRLVGRTLYRLGSAPGGVFVDRFALEVQ